MVASFTVSLLILLLTCAIFTKADWFWVTSSSVLFGLAVVLMPYVAYQLPLGPFWRNNKGLLVFITDTILLIVMLLCIGFYADDLMYWKSTPIPLLYVTCFTWVFFFVCRYLKVSKIIRAGANCILTGVFVFSANYMIDLIVGNDPAWPIINMSTWNELSIDGNAILIEVLASMAEQERIRTLNRQADGILAAKALGKHLGRPRMKVPDGWTETYTLWKGNEITAVEAMKRTGLKKSTFYKLVKLTEETFLE